MAGSFRGQDGRGLIFTIVIFKGSNVNVRATLLFKRHHEDLGSCACAVLLYRGELLLSILFCSLIKVKCPWTVNTLKLIDRSAWYQTPCDMLPHKHESYFCNVKPERNDEFDYDEDDNHGDGMEQVWLKR
ncbi:Protein of unknown function [Gryllus bimaculatus]|nr:Protein of unknown function [Gryllus bimaculatus]